MLVMNVRLPKKMREALEIAAKRETLTATHLIRRACDVYLRMYHDIDYHNVEMVTKEDTEKWYQNHLRGVYGSRGDE